MFDIRFSFHRKSGRLCTFYSLAHPLFLSFPHSHSFSLSLYLVLYRTPYLLFSAQLFHLRSYNECWALGLFSYLKQHQWGYSRATRSVKCECVCMRFRVINAAQSTDNAPKRPVFPTDSLCMRCAWE